MFPRPTIEAFDARLAGLDLRLEAIVIGGSALALLGVTTRQTRDFDIIAPELPVNILEVARAFAQEQRRLGVELLDDWHRGTDLPDCVDLAPTPAELTEALPWVSLQDANPDWPAHVAATLADLGRRRGHGL